MESLKDLRDAALEDKSYLVIFIQLPHAKLLYFVSELWKQKAISDSEKVTIKEMIISDEPRIFEILEKYELNSDENKLKENIIEIVRPKPDVGLGLIIKKNQEGGAPAQDEVSSPLGNQLFERKKRHGNTNELHGLSGVLKPTI